ASVAVNETTHGSSVTPKANEVQQVTVKATGGSFKLTFNDGTTSKTTGAIAWNAPATGANSVQSALEALSNIGAGNVAVTESSSFDSVNKRFTVTYTVTFQGSLGNTPFSNMTFDASGLNAGVAGTGTDGALTSDATFSVNLVDQPSIS